MMHTLQPAPGHRHVAAPSPACCPACGRHVGPVLTCPYCEVDIPDRRTLRLLRAASLVVAISGLALLLMAARQTPLPVTPIGQAAAAHSGRMRLLGTLTAPPRVFPAEGIPRYVNFNIKDDSGRLAVTASRQVARDLVAGNCLPSKGSTVEVIGNPGGGKGHEPRFYLESASSLRTVNLPASPPQAVR